MKQQLEQLLKQAEEVTAKMREALRSMDEPAINMEYGKWYSINMVDYWLIKFDRLDDNKVMVLDAFSISSSIRYGAGFNCYLNQIQSYSPATQEDMQLLPDGHPEKPKPALAATYEEVVNVVKPEWVIGCKSPDAWKTSPDPYQLPTEQAANQHRAFIQIKNLEAYCAVKFEGNMAHTIEIPVASILIHVVKANAPFKFTKEAAEWLIANHPEPFLVFFGVKS